MVTPVRTRRDLTLMYSHARSWSNCKWLILVLPLALSGCWEQDTDQAREIRTRMDEAQVRIEAQAAQIARLERTLSAAVKDARQAQQRQQALRSTLASRSQQLNALQQQRQALQQQRQALLLDQRNLRQALAISNATTRNFNQQLLLAGQQIRFLKERVNTLDALIRQQANQTQTQARELARLREALDQAGNKEQ